MKAPKELKRLMSTLQALQRLIDAFENQGIIIGGVAVSLLGKPRFTADTDAVILTSISDLARLLSAAEKEGFEPRIPDFEELARSRRILLLRHRQTGITCDISLGALPFENEAVDRSQLVRAGNLHLRLPTVEDLIIFKAVAHRPQDMLDIRTLAEIHPDLDRRRVEHWVRQFAELLEMPELWTDVDAILRWRGGQSRD